MSALVTSTVLLAAFMHAVWNAFLKADDDKLLSISGIVIATGIIAIFLVPFVGYPSSESWLYMALSVAAHFIYYIFLSQSYRYGDFAQVYPIARGAAPLLVVLWSYFILKETLSTLELTTICGIIFGIMIFASRGFRTLVHGGKLSVYILLTAISIASYTLFDGNGGRLSQNIPAYMVWLSLMEVFPVILFTLSRRSVKQLYSKTIHWRSFFAAAVSLSAYWMVVWAMTQAPIAMVAALRETSIIIATLIGTFYFKEKSGGRRIVAAIVICISIVVLKLYD